MDSHETSVSKSLKALIGAAVVFFLAAFIESISPLGKGSVIGFFEPIMTWITAYFFYIQRNKSNNNKNAHVFILSFFIILGIGDFFYSLFYYVLKVSSKTLIATFFTTNFYVFAYVLGGLGMIMHTKSKFREWFSDYRNWIPYFITFPLALRLMYVPIERLLIGDGLTYYTILEITGVLTTLFLLSTAMRILINSTEALWSWVSSGIVALVLADWALRVEKLYYGEPQFGFYEYLYFISILIFSFPIVFLKLEVTKIEASKTRTLSATYKSFTLLAVFISLLFLSFSQYGSREAIRITSVGSVVGCLIAAIVSHVMIRQIKHFTNILTSIASLMSEGKKNEFLLRRENLPVELKETVDLVADRLLSEEKERMSLKQSLSLQSARIEIANQVAHDIRSPLAALNAAIAGDSNVPEERRVLIRSAITRIKDIANNLLAKSENSISSTDNAANEEDHVLASSIKIYSLTSLLESILSEKRFQYRNYLNVEIKFHPSYENYGTFIKVHQQDFKRVISNLIDNSIDAFPNGHGVVEVEIFLDGKQVRVLIKDNGCGIAPEFLAEIGQKGKTFGKKNSTSGSGLGLYFSKKKLNSWDGEITISSKLNMGTVVTLMLPLSDKPDWYVEGISLNPNSIVVVVDDDLSIHQVWDKRIELSKPNLHFSNPYDFELWLKNNNFDKEQCVYLIDYEFHGHTLNGIDLICRNKLSKAFLVSSRFEEAFVLEKVEKFNIKMIPKVSASLVPILIQSDFDARE